MLVAVGLVTWAISGLWLWRHGLEPMLATVAWLVFPLPFVATTTGRVQGTPALALTALQALCAVTMGALTANLPASTLAIVAGQLPFLVRPRIAVAAAVLQSLLFGLGLGLNTRNGLVSSGLVWLSYSAFVFFALGAALLAMKERRAAQALALVNAELIATQTLLEHSSRQRERERVSRELHDALGHHLTAVSLQLELAKNLVDGAAAEPVRHAQELARCALSEVRAIVSSLRDVQAFDVQGALFRVARAVPGLAVHVELTGMPSIDTPQQALAVLRCAQEAVTNAARHSGAKNLWLTVSASARALTVSARDDGGGARHYSAGNGLKGLAERMTELGGTLQVEPRPGAGFRLTASLPLGARS